MSVRKILLIQLFSNGDCLYATTIARQIKHDYPACHLTWAIAPSSKNIIVNNPYVDEVLEVASVPKNSVVDYRKFLRQVHNEKRKGAWDVIVATHLMDANLANYDGSIRSAIFHGYGRPVTVPVMPTIKLLSEEIAKTNAFAHAHNLQQYENVVLFEYAPQSGQLPLTREIAIDIAEKIVSLPGTAVILSAAQSIQHPNSRIIDGSRLTVRETAALTHHCSLLLGCSSGITWISTSDAAKSLPLVQLLNPYTLWVNPVSRDFERFGLPDNGLIELIQFDANRVAQCVTDALADFAAAKKNHHQKIPLQFRTTRFIVYNLLCYLRFEAIARHVKVNRQVYGNNPAFLREVVMGFLIFPFRLVANTFRKRILRLPNSLR